MGDTRRMDIAKIAVARQGLLAWVTGWTWLLGAGTAAAAVCSLPDLVRDTEREPVPFEVVERPDGHWQVRMEDVWGTVQADMPADTPPLLLQAEPERGPPGRPVPASVRWLYAEATGWIVVPRSLQVRRAAVGVDGSWSLTMDDGKSAWLKATGTGGCAGCAVSAGSGWFSGLSELARTLEIEPCTVFRPTPQRVPQGSSRVRFHYRAAQSGLRHDGVVRHLTGRDEEGDVRQIVLVGLPTDVRDAVLQRF